MARILEELLHVDLRIAESGFRFLLREFHRVDKRGFAADHAHAASAAATARLDEAGVADLARDAADLIRIIRQSAFAARHAGHAGFNHGFLRLDLVAHQADRLRTRSDEGKS